MNSWKDNVREVVPYTPGEQPKLENIIKLNTNENPYPPSTEVEKAIQGFDSKALRKYPDPACSRLVEEIAATYKVKPSQVFVGVGSDDVLATAFMTLFSSDKPILFPDVTYSFYDVWAGLFKIKYEKLPLNEKLEIVPEDYLCENGGIVFPNPNAPTGLAMPLSEVERIVSANRSSAVIVDEAYVDFGAESALPLVEKYENLLVVQTFSKSRSMAGIRIGFAIGSEEMISYLWAVRNSYNSYTLNGLAVDAGIAALKDDAYFKETLEKIVKTRESSKKRFKALGFEFGDSKANFIFVKHPEVPAELLFNELREEKIFVRYFSADRTRDYLRVTIGTDKEMDRLFEFLEKRLTK